MTALHIPDEGKIIRNYFEILYYLRDRGIHFEKWILNEELPANASDEKVLEVFEHRWRPYMEAKKYQTVDVINVNESTPNVSAIRAKFLKEHTHSEDEVRFFVKGQGLFWFHIDNGDVFSVLCEEGDLISVPAHFRHWFDMGASPDLKVIRMFTDPAGWVANYTDSKIEERYDQV